MFIDMCVKMLNPKESEYVIDPAAGSCGFTVHTIFHIAGQQFTNQKLPEHAREFAQNNVYGVDFDERAVKVSKALNLIAGDGKTNVYRANSLDTSQWDAFILDAFRPHLTKMSDTKLNKANQKTLTHLDFDVLLSNPPFAGKITEKQLLRNYKLAEKNNKKLSYVEIDTLFLERNINFLKTGGRMAIILPQGKFSNSEEEYIRNFMIKNGRILAVISLDGNTFKPHTGTKTSVLFIQKWDDEKCPFVDDYDIFFAVSQKTGKNNSGEYIFSKNDNSEIILDEHGHPKIEHDLDEISNKFIDFARKEHLSFW